MATGGGVPDIRRRGIADSAPVDGLSAAGASVRRLAASAWTALSPRMIGILVKEARPAARNGPVRGCG